MKYKAKVTDMAKMKKTGNNVSTKRCGGLKSLAIKS